MTGPGRTVHSGRAGHLGGAGQGRALYRFLIT